MAATGYTPILIYASGTATNVPLAANLTSGASGAELALNYTDGKLYYKDNSGVVQLLASKAGASGSVTSVDVSGGTTGLTTSGGPVTTSGTITLAGTLITSNGGTGLSSYTAGDLTYYASGTALTKLGIGASNTVLTSSGTAPQWSTSITLSGTATASGFIPSGSSVPTNGLYLPAANAVGISTNSTNAIYINSSQLVGLGTASPGARLTVAGTGYSPNITLTDAATIAWDTSLGQVATFTFVSSNRTMGAPTNLVNGAFYALAVIQNAGSNTLSWNSVFKWVNGTAPTLSTAAGAKDYFVFRSDGTNLYQQGIAQAVA